MSEISRLSAVFFDPKRAFRDIAARPRWWVPLLLTMVMAALFVYLYSQHVGWERYMERALESNPRTQSLTVEQRQSVIEQQLPLVSVLAYVGAVVGMAASALVVAGMLLLVANVMLSAQLAFRQLFAVTCYAYLPSLLSAALAILTMYLKPPEDFDLENPTAFNIGAYLDPEATPKWLVSVASSVDLFSIWIILLLALGLSSAVRRLSYARALTVVVVLWVVWVALKAVRHALF